MVDAAQSLEEVSRQFWALLNPFVAESGTAKGSFANVPTHNKPGDGSPNKALVQKDSLPLDTNP